MRQENLSTHIDSAHFRRVLGHYPTGVCVVTAAPGVGMAVGSFGSVSLAPPLVAFYPDKSSTTWPKIEAAGRFCINVLGAHQETLCRRFASKLDNKFEGIAYRIAESGASILDDALAWIDCDIAAVTPAGDHFIVLGAVRALGAGAAGKPLLFFQGKYGSFLPLAQEAV